MTQLSGFGYGLADQPKVLFFHPYLGQIAPVSIHMRFAMDMATPTIQNRSTI